MAGGMIANGCHTATPPALEEGRPVEPPVVEPGGADKPTGDDGADDVVTDTDPRYIGPEMELRFSAGGVMVIRETDDKIVFREIDTKRRVEFNPVACLLRVNGADVPVAIAEKLRSVDAITVIRITEPSGATHLIAFQP